MAAAAAVSASCVNAGLPPQDVPHPVPLASEPTEPEVSLFTSTNGRSRVEKEAEEDSFRSRQSTSFRKRFRRREGSFRNRTDTARLGEVGGAIAGRGILGRSLSSKVSPGGSVADKLGIDSVTKAVSARRRTKPWFVIDPRRSRIMAGWDCVTTVCLLFTAIVTPVEVSILEAPLDWAEAARDPLFIINRLIDIVFFTDMVLQFMLMIQSFDDREGVKWIDEPRIIIRTYLRGWFALDVMSLVPSAFDLVPLASSDGESVASSRWRPCGNGQRCLNYDASTSNLGRFKAFRILRVCRLIKLTRLLRASRMLRRWETRVSINYASLALGRVVTIYFVAAHWCACVLLLPTSFAESPMATWLAYYDYCVTEPAATALVFDQIASAPLAISMATDAEYTTSALRTLTLIWQVRDARVYCRTPNPNMAGTRRAFTLARSRSERR